MTKILHAENKTVITKAEMLKIKKAVGEEYDIKRNGRKNITISLINDKVDEVMLGFHFHKLNQILASLNGK